MSANPEDLLLPSEFAKAIRWHEESVRRAIREGRIVAIKVGRHYRIHKSELDRFQPIIRTRTTEDYIHNFIDRLRWKIPDLTEAQLKKLQQSLSGIVHQFDA